MNVLYVSTLCSNQRFEEIFENSIIKPQQQAQKFHSLLSKGLMNLVSDLYILSRPPVNKSTNRQVKKLKTKETHDNGIYHYLDVVEIPFLKHINLFISGFMSTVKWIYKKRGQEKIIICDVLNLSISISAFLASKLFGVKSVAIVTDIPNHMQYYTTKKKSLIRQLIPNLYRRLCNYFMCKYEFYIMLTEQMNELVNPLSRPYIVMEGLVDINMKSISNKLQDKYEEKIIIYAGALFKKYGVGKLIEAFIRLNDDNARLWLYGAGEMESEIRNYEIVDNRIKFFGVVPNRDVVQEQVKATLLVNPRPSDEEFTKYSFPSKNMEYMASGTPTVTTLLQGMPKKYQDYVYIFRDETIEGMTKTLDNILKKDRQELHEAGIRSRKFVVREKNSIVQAKRIIEMIKEN